MERSNGLLTSSNWTLGNKTGNVEEASP